MKIQKSRRLPLFAAVMAAAAAGMSDSRSFGAQDLVVPAGYVDTEGEHVNADDLPPTPNGGRVQDLYLPADFAVLGSGPFELRGLALRPDSSVQAPHAFTWDITELNLSTTESTSLSSQFALNRGADVTTVFSGAMQFFTEGSGPSGGPREFDYVIDFDQPYTYDPGQGSLLVEWVYGPNVGNSKHDAADTLTSRTLANFSDSAGVSGPLLLDRTSVIQFTVPEPSSSLLGLLGIATMFVARPRRRS